VIPKRELVFDESEDEVGLRFPPPESLGPRMAEVAQQRYAAFLTSRFGVPFVRDDPLEPDEARAQMRTLRNLLSPLRSNLFYLLGQIPRERVASDELSKMLTADRDVHVLEVASAPLEPPPSSRGFTATRPSPRGEFPSRTVEVFNNRIILLAPSAERAKQLAEAVLSAYDYGLSLPYHQQMVERLTQLESALVEQRGESKKLEDTLAACQKQLDELKPWSDITKESLTNLTTQQRLIAVEEAGLKARIATCERMLKEAERGNLRGQRRAEQVETAKTTAEIELVGLSAKRAAIDELIEKGRKQIDFQARLFSLNQQRSRFAIQRIGSAVAAYKQSIEENLPFAQVQGKIVIRRIRWEEPGAPVPGPAPKAGSPSPGGTPGQPGAPAPRRRGS
jgi:hypothetical protein